MNVNYEVIMSLITGIKLCSDDDWEKLMEAREFLLKDIISDYKAKNSIKPYNTYAPEVTSLISTHLLGIYPQLEDVFELIMACNTPIEKTAIVEKYKGSVPESYQITSIPVVGNNPTR